MLFSSILFVLKFLPFTLFIYFLVPRKFKNAFLLATSILFYAWGEPVYVIIMMTSIVVNYFFGRFIHRSSNSSNHQRVILAVGIFLNLIFLVYFKYVGFIVQNINAILSIKLQLNPVTMPIGISFYTFQSLSYLVDVYRKEVKAQSNIINLGLYISFFPQLIAGPIVRYADINEQIDHRNINLNGFVSGIERFIVGLAKKVFLANTLGEVADRIFVLPHSEITTIAAWLGIICYSLQIFFDFSGYSDMAIGLGRMFGFDFLENFNFPYIAKSIRDFWQRWHISLSTWFRDYLYIPLGGNRVTIWRTYVNLLIVFFITGLWHGASWNFIVWGLFHGFFLLLERTKLGSLLQKTWRPLQHLYTLLIVLVGWVFFRLESLGQAQSYLKVMFGLSATESYPFDYFDFLNQKNIICLALAIILSIPVPKIMFLREYHQHDIVQLLHRSLGMIILICIFILSIADLASDTYNPFIYFRF